MNPSGGFTGYSKHYRRAFCPEAADRFLDTVPLEDLQNKLPTAIDWTTQNKIPPIPAGSEEFSEDEVEMCGPPKNLQAPYLQFRLWENKPESVEPSLAGTSGCMTFSCNHCHTPKGMFLCTLSVSFLYTS